jgi:hypothetical protein
MKHVLIVVLLAMSFGFVNKDECIGENELSLSCSPPSIGGILIGFDIFTIDAVTKSALAEGFVWTVNGGSIVSGQGTNAIVIAPDCPTESMTVCVRAYTTGASGSICYSAEVCTSFNHTGYCF